MPIDVAAHERTALAPDAGPTFVCCLSHDVDRVRHRLPSLRRALAHRSGRALRRTLSGDRPYWRFDEVRALERALGVRSAFYFLDEQSLFRDRGVRDWLRPRSWSLYSYYDLRAPDVRAEIADLAGEGWEVGLHGSYESHADRSRLEAELANLESILGEAVVGGRQHYLNLTPPATWRYHRELGLQYDASLGTNREYGFQYGYDLVHPFDDEFAVFPLTVMDEVLMEAAEDLEAARDACDAVLDEAAREGAVVTVDWHQRTFDPVDFPGYRDVYEYIVTGALERGAWVGPPRAAYEMLVEGDDGVRVAPGGARP